MKKKHIIFVSIIVLIILVGIIAYVFKNNKDSLSKGKSVDLYTIPAKDKIFVNGVIVPEKTENIFRDEAKGSIDKVLVTDGQLVKKGNTLFIYKNDLITDQIDKENQNITNSRNQKNKLIDKQEQAKKLLKKQKEESKQQAAQAGVDSASVGAAPLAATETQISSYSEQIDAAQTLIDNSKSLVKDLLAKEYTYITAPIDGKVILNDSKDITKPYIVIETTTFYVKGSINEKDQTKLAENQQVDILIFAINKTVTGKVKSVGNSPGVADVAVGAQVATGTGSTVSYYDANISLDSQENIVNGFHVQATVKLKGEEMKIPKSSIIEEAGKSYVFKVVNKKLIKKEITYEKGTTPQVIVLSGLNENDSIAVTTKDMKEGISVE